MKRLRWKRINYEILPPQIRNNAYMRSWHYDDGSLSHLVVDGTAESLEGKELFELFERVAPVIVFGGAFILSMPLSKKFPGVGWLLFFAGMAVLTVLHILFKWLSRETRVLTVNIDTLRIKWAGRTDDYSLNSVVGVQACQVDPQRQHSEARKKRKEKDPEMIAPYSLDIWLQTNLGPVSLGSIYGLQEARDITNAINAALQYMKSRSDTGNGPVINPAFQYRQKSAGRIPV